MPCTVVITAACVKTAANAKIILQTGTWLVWHQVGGESLYGYSGEGEQRYPINTELG